MLTVLDMKTEKIGNLHKEFSNSFCCYKLAKSNNLDGNKISGEL